MLKLIAVFLPALCLATSSFAVDAAIKKQLEKLDPSERMEQSCDTEAMKRIADQKAGFKPDKVIAYTFSDPDIGENTIKAPGRRLPQQRRLVSPDLRLRDRPSAHQRTLAEL
jgi:hypothetical protein